MYIAYCCSKLKAHSFIQKVKVNFSRERVAKIFPEPTEDLKVTEKHEVTGVTGAEDRQLMVTWESRSGSFTRDQV